MLAQSGDGRTLARVTAHIEPNAAQGEAPIKLPPELRNQLSRMVLEGSASAGSVVLLDERWRRRRGAHRRGRDDAPTRRYQDNCFISAAR